MSKKVQYGLRVKKTSELCTFYTTSNAGADFCNDTAYHLSTDDEEQLWLVDTYINAEYVRHNSTEWYNAGHDTPNHDYKLEELEVVEVIMTIQVPEKKLEYPTTEEYLQWRYGTPGNQYYDPEHIEYTLKDMKKYQRKLYLTLYDIREYYNLKEQRK